MPWDKIIRDLIIACRILTSYFRKSGKRTHKLKEIATENEFSRPLRYPAYFEVRWSEFTFNLFYVILRNWRSSIKYFDSENMNKELNRWLSLDRLRFLCFVADILNLLKWFQKACQSDNVSILDIIPKKKDLLDRLDEMKYSEITGGWEEYLLKSLDNNGSAIYLHEIKLKKSILSRKRGRNFSFTTTESLMTTKKQLDSCHSFVIPDIEKSKFFAEYYKVADLWQHYKFTSTMVTLQTLHKQRSHELCAVKCALARIVASRN